ncbi:MAG: sulfotransferase, partial [Candidatus Sericytochromatia bacterium]
QSLQALAQQPLLSRLDAAWAAEARGDFAAALEVFDGILEQSPACVTAVAGKAGALEKIRAYQAGYELLRPLVEQGVLNPWVGNSFGTLCLRLKQASEAIPYIEKLLAAEPDLAPRLESTLYFRLGELYDQLEAPQKAFPCFLRANALKPQDFDIDYHEAFCCALIRTFSRELLASLPKGSPSSRPVFIVGMPRSGTTLCEQILCSHPEIYGAGELLFLGELRQSILTGAGDTPEQWQGHLRGFPPEKWAGFARQYLERTAVLAPTRAVRISDKMPENFQYLGLIQALFPHATVIHCRRDPLDTCLSCFSHDFAGLEYSNNLEHLGRYYRSYLDMMAHWRQVLSLPLLEIDYEDLVADPEAVSRKMIAHTGLAWDPRCLDFYKTERPVQTLSYAQVRQPIYASSIGRYRAYAAFLEPLRKLIG